jgi:hypothetical protein
LNAYLDKILGKEISQASIERSLDALPPAPP